MTAASSPKSDSPEPAGRTFGHYTILKELGRGAQGIVFLAEDTSLGRRVALKMLTGAQSQEVRDRFQREAEITSKLNHPAICGLYEVGEEEGVPYLAMQYVPGRTLADMLKEAREQQGDADSAVKSISVMGRSSKGEMQDVIRLIERVATALHVAHEAGLVHRDVKPHNVMVTPEGDPVLLDFGLARDLDTEGQTLTASGQIMGTPAYLAPEQIVADREHIDRRTDVYALGVTLFECVTLVRPYDAPSWDQLYHKILEGNPPNPCKINPHIPKDLRTVIEVAMERDPKRRYPSCKALADDLQRVRSYEAITAKAANLLVRTGKWARRRPGRAASTAVAVVFAVAGTGTLAYSTWHTQQMVAQSLVLAHERLRAGDYVGALEAVAQARTWDQDSARAVELQGVIEKSQREADTAARKDQAFTAAAAARQESQQHLARYHETRQAIGELELEMKKHQTRLASSWASAAELGAQAAREAKLERLKVQAERCHDETAEALQRAARLEAPYGGPSAMTESEFAAMNLSLLREAWRLGDAAGAEVLSAAVARHDVGGVHRAELLGRGSLTVTVAPADAEVFLFRYEDYATVRADDPVPRLVPVPTAGVGRARAAAWQGTFHPGDPCLVVTSVSDGSPAASAGLRPGDLVIAVHSAPSTATFVTAASAELAALGVRPLQRVVAIGATQIGHPFDVAESTPADDAPEEIALSGPDLRITGARAGLTMVSARGLLASAAPAPIELQCLRDGEPLVLQVAAGARAGIDVASTAYPLIFAASNRIPPGQAVEVEPGRYLLCARAADRETMRWPLAVARQAKVTAQLDLVPAGTTPPGFVHVPAGPFARGGDAAAPNAAASGLVDAPEFWIERFEHTNAAWFQFVNDAPVREQMAASQQVIYLPRDVDGKVLARLQADGTWIWAAHTATSASTPVLGVSWRDVDAYLAWRNARAAKNGEPWSYALPTSEEWEKAARGVDGRFFPWGDRFDPSLTVCINHRPNYLLDAPGGYALTDESVYGVFDLAGSREEWSSSRVPDRSAEQAQATYHKLGGSWGVASDTLFRSAGRPYAGEGRASSMQGFRLVARRR